MNSLGPALIAAAAAAMFGDRITGRQVLGIAISLLGVLAIISRLDLTVLTTLAVNWGDLLILFNMTLWAIYSASLRLRPSVHWTSFMFAFAAISAVIAAPFWAWEHAHGFVVQMTWLTGFTFVYVTFFGTIVAFVFWNRGIELIGANRAGIFLHLIPIYSALMTGVLLGEPLMGYHVAGFVLILAGVWLAARRG
jgi:drug/metabolite transporter (DMT)-like permease